MRPWSRPDTNRIMEMSHHHEFDYLIVNDDFNQALNELKSIILSNRLVKSRQQQKLEDLLKNLVG